MEINIFIRFEAACRRFEFEAIKALGIFYFIEKTGSKIKEPYNTLYQRSKRNKK